METWRITMETWRITMVMRLWLTCPHSSVRSVNAISAHISIALELRLASLIVITFHLVVQFFAELRLANRQLFLGHCHVEFLQNSEYLSYVLLNLVTENVILFFYYDHKIIYP